MAEIIRVDVDGEESREVANKEDLVDDGEALGVAFGCIDGRCGSCRVEVIEGMENLSERTQNELDMGLDDSENHRLLCQCKFKSEGVVKIRI